MKRMLFYTYWNFEDEESNGISKKIRSQRRVFEGSGWQVDLSYLMGEDYYIDHGGTQILLQKKNRIWTKPFAENQLRKYVRKQKYDTAYLRYNCADLQFIRLLKELKRQGTRIFVEVPSFPYDKELSGSFSDKVYLFIDKLHRGSMKRYVDRIVIFSGEEEIFGVPTIRTINGIEVDSVKKKTLFSDTEDIHLISVAKYAAWHGLDRLLKGLCNYYHGGGRRKVYLHVVGDGAVLSNYKEMVHKGGIEQYVTFYGPQSGEKLDQIYDRCDIGVGALAAHQKFATSSSSMKSREYLVRGIPFISELKVDIIPEDWEYILRVPYDDSDIDIDSIIAFYDRYMSSAEEKRKLAETIRDFARDKVDMKATMGKIVREYK